MKKQKPTVYMVGSVDLGETEERKDEEVVEETLVEEIPTIKAEPSKEIVYMKGTVVGVDKLRLRAYPSTTAPTRLFLRKGAEVTVWGDEPDHALPEGWLNCKAGSMYGCVMKRYIKL